MLALWAVNGLSIICWVFYEEMPYPLKCLRKKAGTQTCPAMYLKYNQQTYKEILNTLPCHIHISWIKPQQLNLQYTIQYNAIQ